MSKEWRESNNVPEVTELQQQSLISSAFDPSTHPHIPAALTDTVFLGELLWEREGVCSFYNSPHSSSYIKTRSRRPALATAGSFEGAAPGFPRNHLPSLPYLESIHHLPLSLPDSLEKYLTDNLFSPSLFYLHPLSFFPLQFPRN